MTVRHAERVILNMPAEIVAGSNRFAGSIENMSGTGVYVVTASAANSPDFVLENPLKLTFTFPSGEKYTLSCKVKWSYLTPPYGVTNSIGLEILDPPQSYSDTIKSMQ